MRLIKVSSEVAKQLATGYYEKFRIEQDRLFESDFDKVVKQMTKGDRENTKDSHGKDR